jgi:hypothetical protein
MHAPITSAKQRKGGLVFKACNTLLYVCQPSSLFSSWTLSCFLKHSGSYSRLSLQAIYMQHHSQGREMVGKDAGALLCLGQL